MFIDRAKIHVQGGDGGNGVTAFRREKFVPRGGPSGGDGGRGGDVVLVADASLNTLLHLRYNPQHVADRGSHGEGSNRSGHSGADLMVRVPVGTQIFDASTGDLRGGFSKRRQFDFYLDCIRGASEDRGLSVHHSRAASRSC